MEHFGATNARANLYQLIEQTVKTNRPVTITSKHGNAVLIGEDDWRAIQETLHLQSVPGLVDSLLTARDDDESAFVDADGVEW